MAFDESSEPNPVDIHVGARVRRMRKAQGISQTALGKELGITFQQVQKYENGVNRISSSKLYEIARVLQADISSFFSGLTKPEVGLSGEGSLPNHDAAVQACLDTPGGAALLALFPKLPAPKRRLVVALATALAVAGGEGQVMDGHAQEELARVLQS